MTNALRWKKSTRSSGGADNCVEIATEPETTHLRDSKNPGGGTLQVAPGGWAAFLATVKSR